MHILLEITCPILICACIFIDTRALCSHLWSACNFLVQSTRSEYVFSCYQMSCDKHLQAVHERWVQCKQRVWKATFVHQNVLHVTLHMVTCKQLEQQLKGLLIAEGLTCYLAGAQCSACRTQLQISTTACDHKQHGNGSCTHVYAGRKQLYASGSPFHDTCKALRTSEIGKWLL